MDIQRATLDTCDGVRGAAVVIDVIRAFTTAAFAFAAGAREIIPVATVEEALALRGRFQGVLAIGEVGGERPEGFDVGNSPSALIGCDLRGWRLVHRTSAGTQGLVRAARAAPLLAASMVNAAATARYLRRLTLPSVTLVVTGAHAGRDSDEDAACADYLAARLFAGSPHPDFPAADIALCAAADRFDFAMRRERRDGLLVLRAVPVRESEPPGPQHSAGSMGL
jgi:2-phosphosulfolactate phosphatase